MRGSKNKDEERFEPFAADPGVAFWTGDRTEYWVCQSFREILVHRAVCGEALAHSWTITELYCSGYVS